MLEDTLINLVMIIAAAAASVSVIAARSAFGYRRDLKYAERHRDKITQILNALGWQNAVLKYEGHVFNGYSHNNFKINIIDRRDDHLVYSTPTIPYVEFNHIAWVATQNQTADMARKVAAIRTGDSISLEECRATIVNDIKEAIRTLIENTDDHPALIPCDQVTHVFKPALMQVVGCSILTVSSAGPDRMQIVIRFLKPIDHCAINIAGHSDESEMDKFINLLVDDVFERSCFLTSVYGEGWKTSTTETVHSDIKGEQ